jgi:zona occludens toxin (predicted ATPase)
MAGFEVTQAGIQVSPRLAPDWKWLAVENLPFRDRSLTWFAARMRNDINIFTNFSTPTSNTTATNYEEDLSSGVQVTGDALCSVGFRQAETIVVFVGNTDRRTSNTLVRLSVDLAGSYRLRTYNSMLGEWVESEERLTVDEVRRGLNVDLEGRGFAILELQQET